MTQKISVFFAGAVLSVFVLSPAFAQTSGTNADADGKESSIWDDDSSGDSRFFTRKKGRTAADIKREKEKFAPKKKTATKLYVWYIILRSTRVAKILFLQSCSSRTAYAE